MLVKTSHTHNGYPIYTAYVADLAPDEHDLNAGRFQYYTDADQPYRITLKKKIQTGDDLRMWMNKILDWIGSQTRYPWSFQVTFLHIHEVQTTFEFSSSVDAVLFTLTWR